MQQRTDNKSSIKNARIDSAIRIDRYLHYVLRLRGVQFPRDFTRKEIGLQRVEAWQTVARLKKQLRYLKCREKCINLLIYSQPF